MLDREIVRSCAPTLAGIKTGSMFCYAFASAEQLIGELCEVNRRLTAKGLRIVPLRREGGRALLYLYRPRMLERDMQDCLAKSLLDKRGYAGLSANACLACLMRRIGGDEDFPHEIGLFLGYPPEDVDGFINRRHECKLTGLWKVYGDARKAAVRFEKCRRCKKEYIKLFEGGRSLDSLALAI